MPASKLDALIDFYNDFSPDSLGRFAEFYSADAYFKDPFNEVRGVPAIRRIFAKMFEQVAEPRFSVVERLLDGEQAMLIWTFQFTRGPWFGGKTRRREIIRGTSHLRFDAAGRVNYHRDYWDTAEELYMKLPGLNLLTRGLRRLLTA